MCAHSTPLPADAPAVQHAPDNILDGGPAILEAVLYLLGTPLVLVARRWYTMAPLRVIGLIIGIMLIVSPAFAEVIVDETYEEYEDTSGKSVYGEAMSNTQRNDRYKEFFIRDISQANWLNYVVIDTYSVYGYMGAYGNPDQGRWVDTNEKIAPGRYDFTYTLGSGESARTGPGVLYLSRDTNILNQVTATHFTLFLNEWNVTGLSGTQKVSLPFYYGEAAFREDTSKINGNIYHPGANQGHPVLGLRFTYSTANRWMSRLVVTTDESDGYNIDLFRNIDGLPSRTKIDIYDKNDVKTYTSERVGIDESVWSLKDLCHKITLTSSTGNVYNISMTPTGDPGVDPEDPAPQRLLAVAALFDVIPIVKFIPK